jgi:hypothetical protein
LKPRPLTRWPRLLTLLPPTLLLLRLTPLPPRPTLLLLRLTPLPLRPKRRLLKKLRPSNSGRSFCEKPPGFPGGFFLRDCFCTF